MKKIYLLIGLILLCGCNNIDFKLQNLDDYIYVKEHDTKNVIVKNSGLAGDICMKIDYDDAINYLSNIKIKKAVDIQITDSDLYYYFIYDNTVKTFYFQGEYFNYHNQNYEIEIKKNSYSLEEVNCSDYLK